MWRIAMLLAGCSSAAVPLLEAPAVVAHKPQCVWHFTAPSDTSDSDESQGVSNCDGEHISIHDGTLDVDITRDAITNGACRGTATTAGNDAASWFVDVKACDLVGFAGVNL